MKRIVLSAAGVATAILLAFSGVAQADCRPVAVTDLSHVHGLVVLGTITSRSRELSAFDEVTVWSYSLDVEHVYANRWSRETTFVETGSLCPAKVLLPVGARILFGTFGDQFIHAATSVVWRVWPSGTVTLESPTDVTGSDPRIGAVKTLHQAIALLAPLPPTSTATRSTAADMGALSVAAAFGLLVAKRWRRRLIGGSSGLDVTLLQDITPE